MQRCKSPFCITQDGLKGREFEPPKDAQGLSTIWCTPCLTVGAQMQFFSRQTAEMIKNIWEKYENTDLPHNIKLFSRAYTAEILKELGEEL